RTDGQVVAVWRSDWLPTSETFVHNQVEALRQWTPVRLARRTIPAGLGRADVAAFDGSLAARMLWKLAGARAHRHRYLDALESSGAIVMHAHFAVDATEVLGLVRAARLPLVVTCHGYDVTALPARRGARRRRLQRLGAVFAEATRLLAVSDFI